MGGRGVAVQPRLATAIAVLRSNWSILAAGLGFAIFHLWLLTPLPSTPSLAPDSAFFQLGGYGWVHHGRPVYLGFWDLKPPAIFELTALLALLSGPNPLAHHQLTYLVTNLTVAVSVVLVAKLTDDLTGKRWPALVTGLLVVTSPAIFGYAALGAFTKYYVVVFGILTLVSIHRERFLTAAVAATFAAAFYQMAVVFPLVVVAVVATRHREQLGPVLGTVCITTAVLLFPVMLSDGIVPMVNQVIGGSLLSTTDSTIVGRILAMVEATTAFTSTGAVTLLVISLGLAGSARTLLSDRFYWPYAAPQLWFLGKILFIESGSPLDMIPFTVFSAVAVGLLFLADTNWEDLVTIVLVIAVLLFFLLSGSYFARFPPGNPDSPDRIQQTYLNGTGIDTCHFRRTATEMHYVNRTPSQRSDSICRSEFHLDELLIEPG